MARKIKIGDKVRAFLNANIVGEVVSFESEKNSNWIVGATASNKKIMCVVKIKGTENLVRVPAAELFIEDY